VVPRVAASAPRLDAGLDAPYVYPRSSSRRASRFEPTLSKPGAQAPRSRHAPVRGRRPRGPGHPPVPIGLRNPRAGCSAPPSAYRTGHAARSPGAGRSSFCAARAEPASCVGSHTAGTTERPALGEVPARRLVHGATTAWRHHVRVPPHAVRRGRGPASRLDGTADVGAHIAPATACAACDGSCGVARFGRGRARPGGARRAAERTSWPISIIFGISIIGHAN